MPTSITEAREDIEYRDARAIRQKDLSASEYEIVADQLSKQSDALTTRAASLRAKSRGAMATDDYALFTKWTNRASSLLTEAEQFRTRAKQKRSMVAVVTREPRTYHAGGPSWFADMVDSRSPGSAAGRAANERLERHCREVVTQMKNCSPEGARASALIREQTRQADRFQHERVARAEEIRAVTTGTTSGGVFAAPFYAVQDSALYRTFSPVFTDNLTTARPLPPYGMLVEVPKITGTSGVAAQIAENAGLAETDPTATYELATLLTFSGTISASQQLADRAGPIDLDSYLYAQLIDQLDTAANSAVIAAALANATAKATRATYSSGAFLSDVGQLAASLETTAGTVLAPTGLATSPALGEFLLAQVQSDGHSLFMQHGAAATLRADGVSGYAVAGIPLFLDGSIPAVGSNSQLVVANRASVYVYRGEPVMDSFIQPNAPLLTVVFRLHEYAAIVVRYPTGVATVTGNAYPSSPSWA